MEIIKIAKLNPIEIVENGNTFVQTLKDYEDKPFFVQIYEQQDVLRLQVLISTSYLINNIESYLKSTDLTKKYLISYYIKKGYFGNIGYSVYEFYLPLYLVQEDLYFVELKIFGSFYSQTKNFVFNSEPILIKQQHKNSLLIEYTNETTDFDVIIDDKYTPAIKFYLRVRGGFESDGYIPASEDKVYYNQIRQYNLISSVPYEIEKLTIGDSFGVPNWLINKINRILSCTDVKINGIAYTKFENAKLERVGESKFYPLAAWKIDLIKQKENYSKIVEELELDLDFSLSFYPSVITEKTIKNKPSKLFLLNPIKIESINFINNTYGIIKFNKYINLPLFEEALNNGIWITWQVHLRGTNVMDVNNLLQLTEQVDLNSYEFGIINTQDVAQLQQRFVAGAQVVFRSPYSAYVPLKSTPVCEPSNLNPLPQTPSKDGNRFAQFVCRDLNTDIIKVINHYNDGVNIGQNGLSELINGEFTEPERISIYNCMPNWCSNLDYYQFQLGASDFFFNNKIVIPFILQTQINGVNVRRIGFGEALTDFTAADFDTKVGSIGVYAKLPDLPDTEEFEHVAASLIKFNNVIFLAVDVYKTTNPISRSVHIYKVFYTDINNFQLQFLQKIEKGYTKEADDWLVTNPHFFKITANTDLQLFLILHTVSGDLNVSYFGNVTNTNNLMQFNEATEQFENYFSQPLFINYYLTEQFTLETNHLGAQVVFWNWETNRFETLLTQSSGTNKYKISHCYLNLKENREVKKWLKENLI